MEVNDFELTSMDSKHEIIDEKNLKNTKENHLMILTVNSFVGHDVTNADEKLSHVRKAFKYLDQVHPFVSLILQTVAASKEFQIIFDFNRQSIQHLDPTSDQGFRGMFYLSRQIYIAAGGLLNPDLVLDVYGTLIHELCHYAMLLVYNNLCRPYFKTEDQLIKLFTKIVAICQCKRNGDKIVMLAFTYDLDMQHAELIVRVPQLMVMYSKDPVKYEQCRQTYKELFQFCDQFVTNDMESHLPSIKSTTDEKVHEFRKCNKRQTSILISLMVALPFAIWLAVLIAVPYIEPIYSCRNLTDELRSKIFDSTVDFQGINVIFGDLFGRNSSACEHLSPQEVTRMLKVFDAGNFVNNYTEIYENFTAEEVERFADKSEVNNKYENLNQVIYEGKNHNNDEKIYKKYKKIKFREPSLKIHKKVNLTSKFYIERFLTYPNPFNSLQIQNLLTFNNISTTKLLFLSDKGGSGKSTFFRHMAWKLKQQFRLKWISYVDLKQHIPVLKDVPQIDANLTTFVDFISSKIQNLTSKVEIDVFRRKFLSNDSIFLWDGVDEVSPVYKDEVLRLVEVVWRLTGNKQWVATRPHLEEQIALKLNVKSYKLLDYNDDDKKEFIIKFLQLEDKNSNNSSKIVEKIINFTKRLSKKANSQNSASNLQILQMICESYALTGDLRNIYTLYDNHCHELFKAVYKKGEIVKKEVLNFTINDEYQKVHQYFAVTSEIFLLSMNKSAYSFKDFNFKSLEITRPEKKPKGREYLRYKIIYSINNKTLFEHDSYKDFFIAKYIYCHIWESDIQSPRDEEARARLEFLFYIFDNYDSICNLAGDFILGFIEAYSHNQPFNRIIQNILRLDYLNVLFKIGKNVQTVELITKFFKKDRDILKSIWKVGKNQTFFHYYTEKYANGVNELKKIVDENFELGDRKKIYFF